MLNCVICNVQGFDKRSVLSQCQIMYLYWMEYLLSFSEFLSVKPGNSHSKARQTMTSDWLLDKARWHTVE